jgi:phenylpropionate dioxygenase-like ring-hydroxylating dioxygenase large terminal subunit
VFSCPYHAWSFRPDGSLDSVPHRKSYPDAFSLDDSQNHMQRVGRVAIYRGFVFATLNDNSAPLVQHLGAMAEVIDNLVDRAPAGEVEIADSSFTLEYRGNWKLHLENAADIFHPSFVHSSSVAPARRAPAHASILDQDQTREMLLANGFGSTEWEGIQLNGLSGGHVFMNNIYNKGVLTNQDTDPVAVRYRAALTERLGPEGAARVLAVNRFNNIIYPNLVINPQYQQMRVTVPVSVDRTIVHIHCFRLKGAPDEMFHRAVRFLTTLGSPMSMIFSDDVEMLERCQQGLTRDVGPWVDFSRGMGMDRHSQDGSISGAASEMPMRVQFEAWVNYLTAEAA